jgi:hypothetical protein
MAGLGGRSARWVQATLTIAPLLVFTWYKWAWRLDELVLGGFCDQEDGWQDLGAFSQVHKNAAVEMSFG